MEEPRRRARRSQTQRLKIKLFLILRDGLNCYWCDQPFDTKNLPTIEHVKPLSHGGTWEYNNLKLTHEECNKRRADSWPYQEEF